MRRFGSVDMFLEFNDWNFRMGRPVANEGFLRALLTYGTYQQYEFFCPDINHRDKFSQKIKEILPEPELIHRLRFSLHSDLYHSLRSRKYSVFHSGDFTYFMPHLVEMRNRFAPVPFPITGITHSLDGVFMNVRYLELILSGLAAFDGIICSSKAAQKAVQKGLFHVQKQLAQTSHAEIVVPVQYRCIPFGVEESFFTPIEPEAARSFFHIPNDRIVALSVGRLSPRQKMDWTPVLEMLNRMFAQRNLEKLIVLIAGGGEESEVDLLQDLIVRLNLEKQVFLFPNFPVEVKTKLYQAADFYLSLVDNFQETFGINIIEALASGLPVIASDFSGYRELVIHGETGFLIPTLWSRNLPESIEKNLGILSPSLAKFHLAQTLVVDPWKLQEAIVTLYSNEELRKCMGKRARQRAVQFRWPTIIQFYEQFWDELAKLASHHGKQWKNSRFDILNFDFASQFSHYPSQLIQEDHQLSLTEIGQDLLRGEVELLRYEDGAACYSPHLEQLILLELSRESRTLASLRHVARQQLSASHGATDSHLLYLMKHGAITLVKES